MDYSLKKPCLLQQKLALKRPRNKRQSMQRKNAATPVTSKAQMSNSKIKFLALVFFDFSGVLF
jgi:hypothetical protein